jgi:hypothetical protein
MPRHQQQEHLQLNDPHHVRFPIPHAQERMNVYAYGNLLA